MLGICIIAATVGTLLKNYKSEYGMMVTVAAGAVIFLSAVLSVVTAVNKLRDLLIYTNVNLSYMKVALKALGISVITGFISDVCRDFGQNTLAVRAEFAGRCAVFIISVPLFTSLLEIALGFIN